MTPRRELFETFSNKEGVSVRMENHTLAQVKGVGTVKIKNEDGTTVLLQNVRYVPDVRRFLCRIFVSTTERWTRI